MKEQMIIMDKQGQPITILMAEDDRDDRTLTKDAFIEARLANDLRFIEDGKELMDYLCHRDIRMQPDLRAQD